MGRPVGRPPLSYDRLRIGALSHSDLVALIHRTGWYGEFRQKLLLDLIDPEWCRRARIDFDVVLRLQPWPIRLRERVHPFRPRPPQPQGTLGQQPSAGRIPPRQPPSPQRPSAPDGDFTHMSERISRRRSRRPAQISATPHQDRTAGPQSASQPKSFFPKTDRDSIVVMPVGGIGSIGSNWTLYGHGSPGSWILVDAGAGMPPKGVAGIQVVVPDPAQLKPILDRLVAIVVTHAHYDHIGGLPALVPYLRQGTRIYATRFAAECVRNLSLIHI